MDRAACRAPGHPRQKVAAASSRSCAAEHQTAGTQRPGLQAHAQSRAPPGLTEVRASVTLQQHPVGVFGSRNSGLLSPAHRRGRWMLQEGTFSREVWRPPEWTRFLLLTLYVTGQPANARLCDSCLKMNKQDKYAPLFVIQQAKRKPYKEDTEVYYDADEALRMRSRERGSGI